MEEGPLVPAKVELTMDRKPLKDELVDPASTVSGDAAGIDGDFSSESMAGNGTIRTLDGEIVGDELEGDAINFRILLSKINGLLERLKLDA